MQKISLLNLFLIFVKIGAILLGGGYVILPILINEFVENRKLITHDELMDYFAISQSLPGIIASNISIFIGYKLHGKSGALIAMLGIVLVPIMCIILLASGITMLTSNTQIQGALWGVGVSVIALIMLTVREMWQKTTKDLYFYSIFSLTLASLIVFNISPIKTILIFTILGGLYKHFTRLKEVK